MNEASAREVVLLQAVEAAGIDSPHWTPQDSSWASQAALESVGADAPADRFIAERARHALQRLATREPAIGTAWKQRAWHRSWWAWAAAVGGVAGVLVDSIGRGQHINALAPPLWGVVAWNLAVYALLLWSALRGAVRRQPASHGMLVRALQRLMGAGQRWRWGRVGGSARADEAGANPAGSSGSAQAVPAAQGRPARGIAAVLQGFGAAWARHGAALSAARAVGLLHVAAACLALGLLAGMYLRGLVLDYRVAWQSTFLTAEQAHAALSVMLAPAVALSGQALPDVAALDALRLVPGRAGTGAPAAAWIHWYALTVLVTVLLPRLVLALWCAWRARGLAQRFPLPLTDEYFQRLARHQRGGAARVWVLPYAQAVGSASQHGLRSVLARLYGDAVQLHMAPPMAFGAEDELATLAPRPPGTTLAIALFDLTATPENENQGRLLELLAGVNARTPAAGGASTPALVMLVDEAAFAQRFGARSERLAQRRQAWQQLADRVHCPAVFVNLAAPDVAAAEHALQAAALAPLPLA